MKNVILLVVMLFTVAFANAQKENSDSDTTKIKLGNRTIIIVEKNSNDKDTIDAKEEIKDEEVVINKDNKKVKHKKHYNSRAYSRWAGLYLGVNWLRDEAPGSALSSNMEIWQVNPWKSRVWNFNFLEFNLDIIKKHVLLTTGMGFEWRNYTFEENIDLVYNGKNHINPVINDNVKYKKNKLHASYFQIPLLLELNTSSRVGKGLYVAAGVVGGVRMKSKLYQKYDLYGQTIKKKTYDNFNLNPYQLIGTVRVGFNKITFFGNFDMMPLFKDGQSDTGDNLIAVNGGVKLIGF